MRIKTSTLLATAKAIYHASSCTNFERRTHPVASFDNDGRPFPSFERLPPNTKDVYARMAKAAAEAINRDYPLAHRQQSGKQIGDLR